MVIGRGFVRSGSGYVTTPATRAAARAAGTYGATGYSGAVQTASQLYDRLMSGGGSAGLTAGQIMAIREQRENAAKEEMAKATAAIVGTRKRGSGLKVTQAEATQRAEESAARADETAKLRAAATAAKQAKDAAETERLRKLNDIEAPRRADITTPAADITTAPKEPAVCPRGIRYTKLTRWSACDTGYVSTKGSGLTILGQSIYPYMPGIECVCVTSEAGQAIIKSESEPKPTDLPGNGEGFFGGFLGEGVDTGKLGRIVPLVVGGAIVIALLGLFKK